MKKVLNGIYEALPFKKQLFSALKAVWTPPESVYRHLHFKGTISVRLNNNDSFLMKHYGYVVENNLFWAGLRAWEKHSIALWERLCTMPGVRTVLDIGANTGVYAIMAKKLNPAASVYALEPVARVFDKLQENIRLNNLDIHCLNVAASSYDGEAVIFDTTAEHTYSVTVNTNRTNATDQVVETKINVLRLDTIVQERGIRKIDLAKIDVETHEPEVLEGFRGHIAAHRPAILVEILNDEVGRRIQELTEGMGYLYFYIDEEKGISRKAFIREEPHYNYLICDEAVARYLRIL